MYVDRLDLDPELKGKFERLKTDPVYFYDVFFRYPNEKLYWYQEEWLRDLVNPMYKEYAILKGRQIGASWVFGLAGTWYAMMNDEVEVKSVSFNLDQAQKILGYAKNFASRMKARGWYDLFVEGQRGTDIRYTNTSLFEAMGLTVPDGRNVRGHRAHLLFIDEADYIYERMFPSVEPLTLHTGGKTVYLTTAGRVGSHFWKKWNEGNKAEEMRQKIKRGIEIDVDPDTIPPIKSYTVPSTECPDLTDADLVRLRRSLGDLAYNREVLCTKPDAIITGEYTDTIENVNINDQIFSNNNQKTKITKKFKRKYNGDMVNIKATHALPIELTPEHPVLVGIWEHYYEKRSRKKRIKNIIWKKAEDVQVGEYLVCPKLKIQNREINLDLRKYIKRKQRTIPDVILNGNLTLDSDLAELIGYWVAEGSLSKNHVVFNYGKHESELIDRTIYLIEKIFGRSPRIYENTTAMNVNFGCAALSKFFYEYFGHLAHEKKLPFFMFETSEDVFEAFLKAYIAGDGHIVPWSEKDGRIWYSSIRLNSTSKILLLQIQYILTKFNIHTAIKIFAEAKNTKILGRNVKTKDGYELFSTDPKLKQFLGLKTERDKMPWYRFIEDNDNFYLRIKKIKREHYCGDVFNIETENNSYILNNVVVHNCIFAGLADQVFPSIPTYDERKIPTRTTKSCYGGIDVGKVNDPTVLVLHEAHFAELNAVIEGFTKPVYVPYRTIHVKTWSQHEHPRDIAAEIATQINPRFPTLLYSIDATAGYGDQLMQYMTELDLPIRGIDVKSKGKNELMLGSASMEGLQDAFNSEQLWINGNPRDIDSQELLFQLGGYIGRLQKGTGYYSFDSTVGRDHAVDACALAWSSVVVGSFKPYVSIRKRH